ncbi:MAG: hypothetical protein GEU73_05045 [Chloroflexi bacterium]|nr:hypothetical protein [Chloroflexota bacterium]
MGGLVVIVPDSLLREVVAALEERDKAEAQRQFASYFENTAETYNGSPSRTIIAIEFDEDTDGYDFWTWRVGHGGKVLAEGRNRTRHKALLAAIQHLPSVTDDDRLTTPSEREQP